MKLKGLTKLALSGAALAAVAATLGTSTYAWYVTNAKAKVDGINGQAKSIGSGTILVAENYVYAGATPTSAEEADALAKHGHEDFTPEVTLNSKNLHKPEAKDSSNNVIAGLNPVTPGSFAAAGSGVVTSSNYTNYYLKDADNAYIRQQSTDTFDADKTYYAFTSATSIDGSTEWYDVDGKKVTTNNYIQYDIWLYSSDDATVALNYAFANKTQTFEEQVAYASNAPVGVGQSFIMNIKDALRMSYSVTEYVNDGETSYEYTKVADNADYDGNATYYVLADGVTTPDLTDPDDFVKTTVDTPEDADAWAAIRATLYTRTSSKANHWTATEGDSAILDVAACATKSTAEYADFDFANPSVGNANTYYQNVLKKTPNFSTPLVGEDEAPTMTIAGGHEYKLSFYVWLEGTDTNCFDSVAGQEFEFVYTFKGM